MTEETPDNVLAFPDRKVQATDFISPEGQYASLTINDWKPTSFTLQMNSEAALIFHRDGRLEFSEGVKVDEVGQAFLDWVATHWGQMRQPKAWMSTDENGDMDVTLSPSARDDWVKYGRKVEPLFL